MSISRRFAILGVLVLAGLAMAAKPPSPLAARAAGLLPLARGTADPARVFAPSFLAQIPASRVRALTAQLRARFGSPRRLARIDRSGPWGGTVFVDFERAIVQIRIAIEPAPPHRITGLLVTGSEMKGDTQSALLAQLAALPGRVSVSIAALGTLAPAAPPPSLDPERAMAIGSEFKLFILAELVREVKAGERRWGDVALLDRHSLPSGLLQDWPIGSPLTLHSLAVLMISRSDNTAADALLHLLGREKVELMAARIGVKAPERDRPFLSTLEAFALKADPALTRRWRAAGEAERRAMLPPLDAAHVDAAALAGPPRAVDSIEWFASTDDMVRVMDWLRSNADPQALAILAINPGITPAAAARFAYVGYKGGSETGVMAMTFLLRRADGGWRAVSASWNDPAAPVDEARFADLVERLVALQR